jgi:hypothetical protein
MEFDRRMTQEMGEVPEPFRVLQTNGFPPQTTVQYSSSLRNTPFLGAMDARVGVADTS